MYIEFTAEEKQHLEEIKGEFSPELTKLQKQIDVTTGDEQRKLYNKQFSLFSEMRDKIDDYLEQIQRERFEAISAKGPDAILDHAKEQAPIILKIICKQESTLCRVTAANDITTIEGDKLYLKAKYAAECLQDELQLHRQALLKDPHRLQKLREIIIQAVETSDYTTGSLTLDIIDALELSVVYKKFYRIKHSPITDLITRTLTQPAIRADNGNSIVPFEKANFLLTVYGGFDKFTIGADKLYQAGVAELTRQNPGRGKKDNIDVEVKIPFKKFASFNYDIEVHPAPEGVTDPAKIKQHEEKERKRVRETLKTARKRIGNDLKILLKTSLSWEDKDGPVAGLNILQDYTLGPTDGYITLTFTNRLANYLLMQPISQRPTALFYLGAKDINSYNIGCKIADQYSNYTNISEGRNDRLKVETLLAVTSLPTMESLQNERGRNNSRQWYSRIKEPFEAALDKLTGLTIKNWEYVKKKGEPLTDEEAYNITDYETFINLLVRYEPLGEPDLKGAEKVKEAKKAKQVNKQKAAKKAKKPVNKRVKS